MLAGRDNWPYVSQQQGRRDSGDQAAIDRVTRAFLPMHKLDVEAIARAARGA